MSTRLGCCVYLSPHGPATVYAGLCNLRVPIRIFEWIASLRLGATKCRGRARRDGNMRSRQQCRVASEAH
jgi:hypothetical protein